MPIRNKLRNTREIRLGGRGRRCKPRLLDRVCQRARNAWTRYRHCARSGRLPWVVLLAVSLAACGRAADGPPYAAEEALDTFVIEDGFRIEVVAAEPLVKDPVAMDIDEYGRIFVAEMPGYPLDASGTGRVRLLHDTDGDGRPDNATTFADGLRLPTGIMRWREGVIVTDPPDVVYLADTTGNGIADVRHTLLTGFALSNAQHNANKPLYGLDNWIYIANNATISWTRKFADTFGDRGSAVHFPAQPEAPRLARNGADRNLRFRPDTFELESLSSRSQFGQTFDAWGRHFLVNNSRHHMHAVLPQSLFRQGGAALLIDTRHSTSDHGDAAVVYPITERPEHQLLTDQGVFTSACGLTFYLGGRFPEPFASGVTFVAEPVHNLVHVDRVVADGPTFTAERLHEGREFLASTDHWFRPVNFSVGPDGALYVVDYYRQIVEHPEWMDDSLATHGTLTRGMDRGRLYRIVPDDAGPMDWYDRLDLQNTEAQTAHLSSSNAWWRMTAQRLLVDQKAPEAPAMLEEILRTSPHPLARLHALWTLDGLRALTPASIRQALRDTHPGVRENAVRLAITHDLPEDALLPLAADADVRVRFEVLVGLKGFASEQARQAQYGILWRDLSSEWVQHAALLALGESPQALLRQAAGQPDLAANARYRFLERISSMLGAEGTPEAVVHAITTHLDQAPILRGIAQGIRYRQDGADRLGSVQTPLAAQALADAADPSADAAVDLLEQIGLPRDGAAASAAAKALQDTSAPRGLRVRAARILGLAGQHSAVLAQVAATADTFAVQQAALKALARLPGPRPASAVLAAWPRLTPALRQEALAVFITPARAPLLVAALESGQIAPGEIPWRYRVWLMRDTDEPTRSAAQALLRIDKRSVPLTAVPAEAGNAARGQAVFIALCGMCHQAGDAGTGNMGPNLATVRHWPRQALLDKIVDPDRSVASGYEQWILERRKGRRVQGTVTAETPASLTITTQTESFLVARDDIQSMTMVAASAMPPGLLDALDEAAVADLLAFLSDR